MDANAPKLTVVIPTHNRKDMLRRNLEALARQTCPVEDFEVVVVDGGSEDGTPEMMASLQGRFPYRLTSLRQGNLGPGSNRNLGIRHSRGDILLFINDDVLPQPDFLVRHLEFHRQFPEPCWAMLGRVLQADEVKTTSFMRFFEPFAFNIIEGAQEVDFYFFWTCNFSLKRRFVLENGMFNESVGYPAHEDVELGYRLAQKGLRIRYNPLALGHHHHFVTFDAECRHQYSMGYHFYLLWKNVPDWRLYRWVPLMCGRMPLPMYLRKLGRHVLRLLLFNAITVPLFFRPLVGFLDRHQSLAPLARPLYWKVLNYYMRRGIADGLRARSVACVLNIITFEKQRWRPQVAQAK